VVNTYVSRNHTWSKLVKDVPNAVWICVHLFWIGLTSPLFFTPALKCIPILDYTLF
jgi:hypothetical protein